MPSNDPSSSKPARLSLQWQYYRLAEDASASVRGILSEPDFKKVTPLAGYEKVPFRLVLSFDQKERLKQSILSCCLFSAFAVEALVNCLLREKALGFYRAKLESLDATGKYAIAIQIIYKIEIPADSSILNGLTRLSRRRNRLVHRRPSYYDFGDEDWSRYETDYLKPEDAEDSFQACKSAFYKLAEIDSTFEAGPRSESEFRVGEWQELLKQARRATGQA